MENFLPFTDDVMVVLVHKCAQQTHLLALHLETLRKTENYQIGSRNGRTTPMALRSVMSMILRSIAYAENHGRVDS